MVDYTVVWSGRDELLPDRPERYDIRYNTMPVVDDEPEEAVVVKPRRKYTRSGKHAGKFSRTNPNAPHYKPTRTDGKTD